MVENRFGQRRHSVRLPPRVEYLLGHGKRLKKSRLIAFTFCQIVAFGHKCFHFRHYKFRVFLKPTGGKRSPEYSSVGDRQPFSDASYLIIRFQTIERGEHDTGQIVDDTNALLFQLIDIFGVIVDRVETKIGMKKYGRMLNRVDFYFKVFPVDHKIPLDRIWDYLPPIFNERFYDGGTSI